MVLECVESTMTDLVRPRVKYVIGPDGSPLTIADLPPPDTRRWVIRRKAEVVAAVRGGLLSLEEAASATRSRSRSSSPGSRRSTSMASPASGRRVSSNIGTNLSSPPSRPLAWPGDRDDISPDTLRSQIVSTTLPVGCESARKACAFAASSSGKVLATSTLSLPASTSAARPSRPTRSGTTEIP